MKITHLIPQVHDMTTDTVDVISTSTVTANTSPITLSQTEILRFKFLPTLVDNKKEPNKSVSGKLLYEKKRKNDSHFPSETAGSSVKVSRGAVKVGDWMEFQLNTSETYELYQGLKHLYALYDDIGEIPYGSATYTRVDSSLRQFLSIIQNDPSAARMIGNEENYDLFKTLLRLITQTSSLDSLKKSLAELQDENAQHLAMSLNIVKLQRVATLMADNLDNNSEEFWQTTVFKENQWVLAQIFACPCTIFSDKAYVGGKGVDNSGGNLCDFIYQNRLSQNVALIEIKTPCTEIIGNSYRGTYSFSHELSGAVNQVLNYRDNLTKSYYTLCHQSASQFEVLSPKCVVIIGKLASMNSTQIAAFESFRNSLSGVQILTFDELYQRVIDLIAILSETPSPTQHTPELEDVGKEFPFLPYCQFFNIVKNQFYAGCVYVELTGYKFAHGHTSKMFFEVNQAVNFRVIIGGNHIEICRKSFKISRCERLVRIK